MEALFLKLVNMSITASWLVLAIIAVRLIFKKAPKCELEKPIDLKAKDL